MFLLLQVSVLELPEVQVELLQVLAVVQGRLAVQVVEQELLPVRYCEHLNGFVFVGQ